MGKLTDLEIKSLIRAGKPIAKSDGDGLTFTLSSAGAAAWVLRYSVAGKRKEKTIGRYPDISLTDARKKASIDRAKVQQGSDVAREKQIEKRESVSAWTVRQLAADYEEKALAGRAAATIISRRQKIRTYVLPAIGHLPARDVVGSDIVELLETAADKFPGLVKPVLGATRLIFGHGIAKKIVVSNPCSGITVQAVAGREANKPARDRHKLTDSELKAILEALPRYSRIHELVVRILLATAVRIQALMLTEWEHIDFEKREWTIPSGEGRKSKREFVVPLTESVAGYFSELRSLAGHSKYVLPIQRRRAGKEGDRHQLQQAINHMINRLCADQAEKIKNGENVEKIRDFTPHDLRSTARSNFAALGIPLVIAERCLNHALGGLVDIYDQHDYLTERRRALELWGAKLAAIEAGANNVISITSKTAA